MFWELLFAMIMANSFSQLLSYGWTLYRMRQWNKKIPMQIGTPPSAEQKEKIIDDTAEMFVQIQKKMRDKQDVEDLM